jgi:hypothetical protein
MTDQSINSSGGSQYFPPTQNADGSLHVSIPAAQSDQVTAIGPQNVDTTAAAAHKSNKAAHSGNPSEPALVPPDSSKLIESLNTAVRSNPFLSSPPFAAILLSIMSKIMDVERNTHFVMGQNAAKQISQVSEMYKNQAALSILSGQQNADNKRLDANQELMGAASAGVSIATTLSAYGSAAKDESIVAADDRLAKLTYDPATGKSTQGQFDTRGLTAAQLDANGVPLNQPEGAWVTARNELNAIKNGTNAVGGEELALRPTEAQIAEKQKAFNEQDGRLDDQLSKRSAAYHQVLQAKQQLADSFNKVVTNSYNAFSKTEQADIAAKQGQTQAAQDQIAGFLKQLSTYLENLSKYSADAANEVAGLAQMLNKMIDANAQAFSLS